MKKRTILERFVKPEKSEIEAIIKVGYVVFYNIKWDTDGAKPHLPKAVAVPKEDFDADTDFSLEGADFLSDKYGWCVNSFSFKTEPKSIEIVQDFFNKAAQALDKKYYPEVKYYRDNENTTKIHYALERFNNGVLTYTKLIDIIAKACKDTKKNIHAIVSQYIKTFGDFEYKP